MNATAPWKSLALLATCVVAGSLICWFAFGSRAHRRSGFTIQATATPRQAAASQAAEGFASAWLRLLGRYRQLTDSGDLRQTAEAAAAAVPPEQLPEAIELAARHEPTEAMQEMVAQLLLRWTEFDPAAAAARACDGLQPYLSEENVAALFMSMLARDAGAAARLSAAMNQCVTQEEMLATSVARWATANRADAIAWLGDLPDGVAKTRGLEALLHDASSAVVHDLAATVASLSADHVDLQRRLVAQWAEFDPFGALKWAETLTPGDSRDQVLPLAMALWTRQAPGSAVGYLAGLPTGPTRDNATLRVVSAWAYQDPVAAASWLTTITDPTLKIGAVENLVRAWSQVDPLATANWLTALPEGRAFDRGLAELSRNLRSTQPEVAFALADGIGSRELRWQQLERVARSWLAMNPELAIGGIASSDLPTSTKERLIASASVPPESSP